MPETNIKLVVFDIGGVWLRIQQPHLADDAEVRARLMPTLIAYETGLVTAAQFDLDVAEVLEVSPQAVRTMADEVLREPFPGVDALLDALQPSGVTTACLSNTNAEHWAQMQDQSGRSGIPLHRLDHRFASHLAGLHKPDPAIYAYVEKATGFQGSEILFFDDTPVNTAAAQAFGWHTVTLDPAASSPVEQMRAALTERGLIPR